jgi:hypothetical protein
MKKQSASGMLSFDMESRLAVQITEHEPKLFNFFPQAKDEILFETGITG